MIRYVSSNVYPRPKSDFAELVGVCLDFQLFVTNDIEYVQVYRLAMDALQVFWRSAYTWKCWKMLTSQTWVNNADGTGTLMTS